MKAIPMSPVIMKVIPIETMMQEKCIMLEKLKEV